MPEPVLDWKKHHVWKWHISASEAGTWTFVPPDEFTEIRAQFYITGDFQVEPKPYLGKPHVSGDPGDAPLAASSAAYAPIYRFQQPSQIDFVITGSSGTAFGVITGVQRRMRWRGEDLP